MAIYCAKCGGKVGVTGPCRKCKRMAKRSVEQGLSCRALENAHNHLKYGDPFDVDLMERALRACWDTSNEGSERAAREIIAKATE